MKGSDRAPFFNQKIKQCANNKKLKNAENISAFFFYLPKR